MLFRSKTVAKIPAATLLMFSFAAMNFVAVVQLAWIPTFLYQRFHLSLSMAALFATLLAQVGAVGGATLGGILADRRSKAPGGRVTVQITGALLGVPFVFLCGQSSVLPLTLVSLFGWGFCKGLYDANIFASLFDLLPTAVRGVSTGTMNSFGWLLGGTSAPIFIGYFATRIGLGNSISSSALGYLIAGGMLTSALLLIRKASAKDTDRSVFSR